MKELSLAEDPTGHRVREEGAAHQDVDIQDDRHSAALVQDLGQYFFSKAFGFGVRRQTHSVP